MDISYIKNIIQSIIDKEFSTPIEKRIDSHDNRLNFRCPYCHEGRTKTKKRGNLYFDKLIYVCFRCGKKTNFDRFTKDFNIRLDPNKKLELIDYLNSVISYKDAENDFLDTEFNKLIDLSDIERIFNSGDHIITDFRSIIKNGEIYKYLILRGIPDNLHDNIYQGKYWILEINSAPGIEGSTLDAYSSFIKQEYGYSLQRRKIHAKQVSNRKIYHF